MLRRLTLTPTSWDVIWSLVQRVLVVNAGVALTNLPLLAALSIVAQPWRYPVFFGALSLSLGPAVVAAFGYLHGDGEKLRDFARAYRRHFARALGRWTLTVGLLAVLLVDVAALHDTAFGPTVVPLLVVTSVLTVATGLLALALLVLRPDLGLLASLRLAVYAAVRRAWLSLLTLVVLLAAVTVVNRAPLLGLATVPGFALIVAWSNTRASLSLIKEVSPG